MSRLLTILYLFINLNYILIECLVPGNPSELSVRKVDNMLIAKKRQDTVDMCRIFTEELGKTKEKEEKMKPKRKFYSKYPKRSSRVKRELPEVTLKYEDAEVVEKIVDKMYDDLQDNGEKKVAYRRANSFRNNNFSSNVDGRRYNFAPAILEAGESTTKDPHDVDPSDESSSLRFKHGIIPYFIDPKTYDNDLAEIITNSFDYLEKVTCLRLQRLRERPVDNESLSNVEWLFITNPTGIRQCVHSNDQAEIHGVQMVVFGYDCMSLGDIVHELMHILGFSHEHVRPDRDQYITILWDNIKPGYKKFFEINKDLQVEKVAYDYESVLHYPPRAFSRNGQVTIMTKPGVKIGQRDGLSEMDIEKISTLYSSECIKRNKEYLLATCPNVVKANKLRQNIQYPREEIDRQFKHSIWLRGIVNYKLNKSTPFTLDELANIYAVIAHIEAETCIEFRKIEDTDDNENSINDDEKNKTVPYNAMIRHDKENEIKTDVEQADFDGPIALSGNEDQLLLEIQNVTDYRKNYENRESSQIDVIKAFCTLTRSEKPGCVCPENFDRLRSDASNIELSTGCFDSGNNLLHVFGHILGLVHQHNSYDRDYYITILWDQLSPNKLKWSSWVSLTDRHTPSRIFCRPFEAMRESLANKTLPIASLGFSYDYLSIMHFPWLQIKDGQTNIMYPNWNDGWIMGHWQGLSPIDVAKINLLYETQCMIRKKIANMPKNKPQTVSVD